MSGRGKKNDEPLRIVIIMFLALIAMPIIGVYLISRKEPVKCILGWFLFLIGIFFWIFIAIHQG